jgi:drug/metabolite transporter (DMT)-like permease
MQALASAEAALPDQAQRRAHRRALLLMVIAPALWSTAGMVTRWLTPELQQQGRFEVTFWRSLAAALFVAAWLGWRGSGLRAVREAGWPGLLCGAMWAVMFTAFMLALTLTTVANVLLVMSLGPLVTALLARAVLKTPIAPRTWVAIAAATVGIGWMAVGGAGVVAGSGVLLGMAIAFTVPLASAINLVTLEKTGARLDLLPAVFLGGMISAALTVPLALPLRAAAWEIALLAGLGVFQLGVPCMLLIVAARDLSAPELALLALLEVVLGPLWAWLGAGEVPAPATLAGGAVVLGALVVNEIAALRRSSR